MFFTELLHGHSAARLCSDSFAPLVCFRVARLLLDESVAHDTTMQHRPAFQEERFTRRLRLLAFRFQAVAHCELYFVTSDALRGASKPLKSKKLLLRGLI
jgi:hypothetical protein